MRKIDFIAVHCTGTSPNTSIKSIIDYWKNINKWTYPGYHYIIEENGTLTQLLSIEKVSNGVHSYNHNTINVAYIGGLDKGKNYVDTRTAPQKESLLILLKAIKREFPKILICGHRDFPNVHKSCPCFNAIPEYKDI